MFLKLMLSCITWFIICAVLDVVFKFLYKIIMAPFIIAGKESQVEEQENGQEELDRFIN